MDTSCVGSNSLTTDFVATFILQFFDVFELHGFLISFSILLLCYTEILENSFLVITQICFTSLVVKKGCKKSLPDLALWRLMTMFIGLAVMFVLDILKLRSTLQRLILLSSLQG